MAKHPHRLMLSQGKTWRCTLPGCRYFIHIGLAHTLPGQLSICWGCSEEFMLDEHALKEEQPRCDYCRAGSEDRPSVEDISKYAELQIALSKAGVKSIDELTPVQRNTMKALGILPKDLPEVKKDKEPDAPTSEET